MGKLELKKQKKKDALFNTAFELFTTKGTNQTTISDIVNKAGVAKGTFYLYFKDKYDIRNKLVSHKTSELFYQAYRAVIDQEITGFRAQLHFMIDFCSGCPGKRLSASDVYFPQSLMGCFSGNPGGYDPG